MVDGNKISTGIQSFNQVIDGLRVGDNVVWQVDSIKDYQYFTRAFAKQALSQHKRVIYIRFAKHKPLLEPQEGVTIYNLDADNGFESFSTQIHRIITNEGEGAYYVFDCLSHLLYAWATDLMIGHFFFITCPYLYELDTIAYFSILRRSHSFNTVATIRRTTQVLINIYNVDNKMFLHPQKAQDRFSPTMFLPHLYSEDKFLAVTNSFDSSRLLSVTEKKQSQSAKRKLDYWDRLFLRAENILYRPINLDERKRMASQLSSLMLTRDKKLLKLINRYFSLQDLLRIKERLVGTGYVGGKSVGMLLARAILAHDSSQQWEQSLEEHDSYYIGSDVFYSYIVENGWWKLRMEQKTKDGYFSVAGELQEKILNGRFSPAILEQFQRILDYFGQSPIIVRSSSLLEDGFGNAFAGKYESIFCANQGTPEERYQAFEDAVRKIYASMLNEDALTYRMQRGLAFEDEQMALLVQRVSGAYHGNYYFPFVAGVGISYNTFVWHSDLDSEAGMLRLVYGLGTRAVNRVEEDYPRLAALDAPLLRPVGGMEDKKRFSQHYVDLINVKEGELDTVSLRQLLTEGVSLDLDLVGVKDYQAMKRLKELKLPDEEVWILTFDKLLSETEFPQRMQRMLKLLETAYDYPVDIEFAVNITDENQLRINLLQCRPLQTKGQKQAGHIPKNISQEQILFETTGSFMGGSIFQPIKRIIYVEPNIYSSLSETDKYGVARLIGKINKLSKGRDITPTMLIGPGRWGTTTPALGVPVSFSEISNMSVLVEVAHRDGRLTPELSYGSHFFQDLVETEIFYVALFPGQPEIIYQNQLIAQAPNSLDSLVAGDSQIHQAIKVWDIEKQLLIASDIVSQKAIGYFESANFHNAK